MLTIIIICYSLLLPGITAICSKSAVRIAQYLETFVIYSAANSTTVDIRPQSHLPVVSLLNSVDLFNNKTIIEKETTVADNSSSILLTSLLSLPILDCSTKCIHEIQTFISSTEDSILHIRGPPSPLDVPWGYIETNPGYSMYCARSNGTCGATIPIYRHYKITTTALYHSYSFGNSTIKGYIMEPTPLCYAWPRIDEIEQLLLADDPAPSCMAVESQKLVNLNYFANNEKGFYKDHMLTTAIEGTNITEGYHKLTTFGRVLPSSNSHLCSCTVQLNQMRDNQTGILGRLDSKLVVNGTESDQPYEKYKEVGETFYCAKEKDACGATVPLYKHFQVVEMDSIYTTKEGPLYMAYPYPAQPLCYIWPTTYRFSRDLPNRMKKAKADPRTKTTVIPEAEESLQETTTVIDGTTGVTHSPLENTTIIDGSITIIQENTAEKGATVTQSGKNTEKQAAAVTNTTEAGPGLVGDNSTVKGEVTVIISNGNDTAEVTTTETSLTGSYNRANVAAALPLLGGDIGTAQSNATVTLSNNSFSNTTKHTATVPLVDGDVDLPKENVTAPSSKKTDRITTNSTVNSTKSDVNTATQTATVTPKNQKHQLRQTSSDEGSKPMDRMNLSKDVIAGKETATTDASSNTLDLPENTTQTHISTAKPNIAVTFKTIDMKEENDQESTAKASVQVVKRNITSHYEKDIIDADLTRPFIIPGSVPATVTKTAEKVATGPPKPVMAVVNSTVVLLHNTTDVSFKKIETTSTIKLNKMAKIFKTV